MIILNLEITSLVTNTSTGHETTSGMLSFLFQFLLKCPAAYQAAQREVDAVIGRGPVTIEHMSKLPYLTACLRETLRLCPTAAVWTVTPVVKDKPTIIGGKYEIHPGQPIIAILPGAQRDPKVFGENANAFVPERMLDEEFNKLPKNSWKVGHPLESSLTPETDRSSTAFWERCSRLHRSSVCMARGALGHCHAPPEFQL